MGKDRDAQHVKNLQRIKLLRPVDDEFMRCLFRGQLMLAQEVLRIITGIDDLVLTSEETQRDVKRLAGARSVCLDVYGKDSSGRRYNLEVQRDDAGAGARRARYHSSAMDVEALLAGQGFGDLPESYVIFVTERDVFGRGAGVYRFDRYESRLGIKLGDGAHVLYANASYKGPGELGDLMHDFLCSDPDEMRTLLLAERARYYKQDPGGVVQMSKILEEMCEEARQEGIEQGIERERLASIRGVMDSLKVEGQKAMDILGIPASDRAKYFSML